MADIMKCQDDVNNISQIKIGVLQHIKTINTLKAIVNMLFLTTLPQLQYRLHLWNYNYDTENFQNRCMRNYCNLHWRCYNVITRKVGWMGKWIDTKMLIIKLKTALATCSKSPEQLQHIMCITSEAKLYIRNKTQNHKNDSPIQN